MQQLVKHRQRTNKINNYIFYYHTFLPVLRSIELLVDVIVVVEGMAGDENRRRLLAYINSLLTAASWLVTTSGNCV